MARTCGGKGRNVAGEPGWARGYFVSRLGRDERGIRQYLEQQEAEDKRLEQREIVKKD